MSEPQPVLRVVSGSPTAEDVAVVTAVLAASSGDDAAPAPRVRRGGWNDPQHGLRRTVVPGPNAWRSSAW